MVTTDIRRFGALLKHYRRAAGLTQEALADRARLSVRGIQDLERGVSRAPRPDTVALLASALGLSTDERAALGAAARPVPVAPAPVAAGDLVPLIGRDAEVALLERFVVGAAGPPVLLLTGEPGIGKTRLLQAAAARAVARGWTVLAGGCQRRGGQAPYAPLLDALARHLHTVRPERLRDTVAGCAWLARLLPEFAPILEPPPVGTLSPEQERRLMFAAVARLLSNVAGPAGTLLALDDLQWAGPDALDLLSALVHAPLSPLGYGEVGVGTGLDGTGGGGAGGGPLRVVGAYRDTEVGPGDPLGLLAADLAQARLLQQRALGPLGREEAAALLDDLLGADAAGTAEGVLERADGMPFYLVSYAQALRSAPAPPMGAGARAAPQATVPWDVAQGVRQRVALLPAAARETLGAAAVVGRSAGAALIAAALERSVGEALDGLEMACRARLLAEDGDDAYAFAHDVIREVVEGDLSAARRAALHRRIAEALERGHGRRDDGGVQVAPELLAYHHGAGGDAAAAARAAEEAGDRAWGQRAPAAAEGSYGEALGHLEGLGPAAARAALRMREKLGEMRYQTGRYAEAADAWGPAVEAYRAAGDWENLGRAAARLAWAHARRGAPDAGLALLAALPSGLAPNTRAGTGETPSSDVTTAAAHAGMAAILLVAGRYDEALSASERACALARGGGGQPERARADGLRLDLLDLMGRLGDALALGREVLPLAEAADDPDMLLRLHRNLAYVHARRGDLAASRAHLARALEVATRLGDPAQWAYTLALGARVAVVSGDWVAAQSALDEAAATLRADERSWYAPYIPGYRAFLALAVGDRTGAAAEVAEAEAALVGSGNLQARRTAAAVAAELDILAGWPEAAVARLTPLLDRPGLEESDVTELLPTLAWAQLEQGHATEADATVERALARARREGMRPVLVEALRVGALVALHRGDDDAAARDLREGLALAREMPYPYAEMRLLQVEASLRARRGEDAAARCYAEAARAIQARLGADLAASRPAPPPATAPIGATPAQVEAADGAPEGRRARLSPTERQDWIVARLRAGEALSPRAYVAALGLERRTAIRDLHTLEERGLIEARGTTKDRRYIMRHNRDERSHP